MRNNIASNNTAVGYEAGYENTSGTEITAVGYQALKYSTGAGNAAFGSAALTSNTTGVANTSFGNNNLSGNTTGNNNTSIGYNAQSGDFDSNIIIGRGAVATASNQFVTGSAAYPSGAITTEVVVSDTTWSVRINGTAYKILLKA